MMRQLCRTLILAAVMGFVVKVTPALGAETVILKYGIIKLPVQMTELENFVATGEMSPTLTLLLSKTPQRADTVRRTLGKSIRVNPEFLEVTLNRKIGQIMLDQVGQVIYPNDGQKDREGLRSALLLSAQDNRQLTILETIKNYPSEEVIVDGERLMELYQKIANLSGNFAGVTDKLRNILDKIKLPQP